MIYMDQMVIRRRLVNKMKTFDWFIIVSTSYSKDYVNTNELSFNIYKIDKRTLSPSITYCPNSDYNRMRKRKVVLKRQEIK